MAVARAIRCVGRPAPAPPPRATPPEPAPPKPVGVVSSSLRPWLDIEFTPLRCVVEDERVVFEFEVNLLNSGGAAARDVLVEASIFNAGPTHERDIRAFFGQPTGAGERSPLIPALQRLTIRSALAAPRANLQAFAVAGRQVFVPLIAFNASYRLGRTEGRTSAAFMLGRNTQQDKLGPLRLDLGPRDIRGLGARVLPTGLKA